MPRAAEVAVEACNVVRLRAGQQLDLSLWFSASRRRLRGTLSRLVLGQWLLPWQSHRCTCCRELCPDLLLLLWLPPLCCRHCCR